MFDVSGPNPVPELSMRPLVNEKFVVDVPWIPSFTVFWMNIRSIEMSRVLVSDTALVVFRIVPPVQVSAEVQVPPFALTVRPPLEPVLFRAMPLAGSTAAVLLPAEMLWNVGPSVPMVVLETLRAAALVAVRVLLGAVEPLVSVTAMVPPPVALNAGLAPVDALM